MGENWNKLRSCATSRQGLLIGVLALIFTGVLIAQFGNAGGSSAPIDSSTAPVLDSRRPPNVNGATGNQKSNARRPPPKLERPWPGLPLATVLQYDPFAQTSSLAAAKGSIPPGSQAENAAARRSENAERKRTDRERVLAEVHREVVRTIVGTDKGFVAMVGTKMIREGDRLHGLLVKRITPDGVVLEATSD